jgi:hypothetical protein
MAVARGRTDVAEILGRVDAAETAAEHQREKERRRVVRTHHSGYGYDHLTPPHEQCDRLSRGMGSTPLGCPRDCDLLGAVG